eukprot:CAMPEP_0171322820 /NCGR_PEP_ID=MMETSP0816-20121228/115196_1 /TAXON_ID=420281 /ORGANISM="Proboscia inermis, Strain CCAP1064/1" /LENGTH=365 /DNA_ID=CAMNT_0011821389 /DNA_START=39 /DNA_END=1136 /DNA_ORIENTATION=-
MGISTLLHGEDNDVQPSQKSIVNPSSGRLAGGRDANAPSALTPDARLVIVNDISEALWAPALGDVENVLQGTPDISQDCYDTSPTSPSSCMSCPNRQTALSPAYSQDRLCNGKNHDSCFNSGTPVEDHFTAEVCVILTCESCCYRRSRTETYRHFSLQVDDNGAEYAFSSHVEESLRKYFTPQSLELKCEQCFHGYAKQTMLMTRMPRILLLHLNRFVIHFNTPNDYSSIEYKKNTSRVGFMHSLDMSEYCLDSQLQDDFGGVLPSTNHAIEGKHVGISTSFNTRLNKMKHRFSYSLKSVVHHIGDCADRGHYTADAMREEKKDDGLKQSKWMRFNDSLFNDIGCSKVNSTKEQETAYMFMYEMN